MPPTVLFPHTFKPRFISGKATLPRTSSVKIIKRARKLKHQQANANKRAMRTNSSVHLEDSRPCGCIKPVLHHTETYYYVLADVQSNLNRIDYSQILGQNPQKYYGLRSQATLYTDKALTNAVGTVAPDRRLLYDPTTNTKSGINSLHITFPKGYMLTNSFSRVTKTNEYYSIVNEIEQPLISNIRVDSCSGIFLQYKKIKLEIEFLLDKNRTRKLTINYYL